VSHLEWLRTRTPVAPPALVSRIATLLADNPTWESRPRPEAFVEAAEQLLHRVLERDAMDRACSLDLLAADACVTYAFEAAADEPGTVEARADEAIRRIASLAADPSRGASPRTPA
jgi:hypothetical protein